MVRFTVTRTNRNSSNKTITYDIVDQVTPSIGTPTTVTSRGSFARVSSIARPKQGIEHLPVNTVKRWNTAKAAVEQATKEFMNASKISNKALDHLQMNYNNPLALEAYVAANSKTRAAGERRAAAIKERNAVEAHATSGGRTKRIRRRTHRRRKTGNI